ncbi:MAG TPA: DNA mismatch repair protein [Mycobacteriales bacterium]|nr:DNA mismatch repair protein [Mycobacteriales bacterium]
MKVRLLFRDEDLGDDDALPAGSADVVEDLGLETVFHAMAASDPLLREVAARVVLRGLATPEQIRYRQQVLADCLAQRETVRVLYDLAGEALTAEKGVWGFLARSPEGRLRWSVDILERLVPHLRRLRGLADAGVATFGSEGFTTLFGVLRAELADDYFDEIRRHLATLRLRTGVLVSAELGAGLKGVDYRVRRGPDQRVSWWRRLWPPRADAFTVVIAPRDEAGSRALGELRARGIDEVANAVAQAAEHVLGFFAALRTELAFYLGCTQLYDRLAGRGISMCFPTPGLPTPASLSARGLCDPVLALRSRGQVVGNDLDADGARLVVITGANQGGKSTLLRSVAVGQLMMQAGMFVAAASFAARVCAGVFTHYKRGEDAAMVSGKFDEELVRMDGVVGRLTAGDLLVMNESFSSTTETEGAQIAGSLIEALLDEDVTVMCVTHSYELAERLRGRGDGVLFLRAERRADGERTFRVLPGAAQPTSHSEDVYRRVFGRPLAGRAGRAARGGGRAGKGYSAPSR